MKLRNALVFIGFFPLTALILGVVYFFHIEFMNYKEINRTKENIQTIGKIDELVHEFQKERGLSISFLESDENLFKLNLINQIEKTNLMLKDLNNIFTSIEKLGELSSKILQYAEDVKFQITRIQKYRDLVTSKKITPENLIEFYINIIENLLSIGDFLAKEIKIDSNN